MKKEDASNISKYSPALKMDYNSFVYSSSIVNQPKRQKHKNHTPLQSV